LFPCEHEFVRDVGELAIVGGERTVRLTGIVCGEFDEPGAFIVIVAE